jgi:hypothetical protein
MSTLGWPETYARSWLSSMGMSSVPIEFRESGQLYGLGVGSVPETGPS